MYLSEAVDEIREKLVKHRLAPRKFLWRAILKQIAKQDCFDGVYIDTIQEMIRALLRTLDDATIVSLWRETEVGVSNDNEADRYFTDDLRSDVEMEILQQITDVAWYEATGKWPTPRRDFDDPEPDWD
jgi:hypothetical protein